MLFVHRMLLRDPPIWMRKLEQLTSLALRSALQLGRAVFRADPEPLQRHFLLCLSICFHQTCLPCI